MAASLRSKRPAQTWAMTEEGQTLPSDALSANDRSRTDFVEKVEKSSRTKTRQIAIRWNIAIQHHLRPVADLARCPIDKLAGPPADFLNAAPIGLPENRISPKGSFSTQSGMKSGSRGAG